jgi:hypothetical protein
MDKSIKPTVGLSSENQKQQVVNGGSLIEDADLGPAKNRLAIYQVVCV